MRRMTLLIASLWGCLFMVQAQTVEDDFEGNGTIDTWFGDDCGLNTSLPNPVSDATNPSATVLEYQDVGGQFANVRFDVPSNFDLSVHHTFSLQIYVPSSGITGGAPNQVSLKLQDGNLGQPWTTQSEIIKPILVDKWQTLTFDFANDAYINLDGNSPPPTTRADFNRVLIQVNGEDNNDQVLAYIDDVTYDGTITMGSPGVEPNPDFNELVWSDEFDNNGPVDASKWFHQTQIPVGDSWFNGEVQHYTNRLENSYVDDGILHVVAKRETFMDQGVSKEFTSARLNSKYAFTYGRVEVRAKLPFGPGTWPAIWTLGQNITESGAYWETQGYGTTSWPACGEIDIMEHWGTNQNFVQSATHTPSSFGATVNHGGQVLPTASSAFHIYTLDWYPDRLVFAVDDVEHFTYQPDVRNAETWPFVDPHYLILNVAIQPVIEPSFTESDMKIDYIRVYQEGQTSNLTAAGAISVISYPNPVDDVLHVKMAHAEGREIACKLYDLSGKELMNMVDTVRSGELVLTGFDTLARGTYVLSLDWGDAKPEVLRISKR